MSPHDPPAVSPAERDPWSSFTRHLLWGVGLLLLAMLGGRLVVDAVSLHGPMVDLKDGVPLSAGREPRPRQLRLAVAPMYSPQVTFLLYQALVQDLGQAVNREATLCLKSSNRAVREELLNGALDVAIVSPGTYALLRDQPQVELLAMPELLPGLSDRSEFLVAARSPRKSLDDLRGARFAYTDPESNTGCVLVRAMLAAHGWVDDAFFSEITFTGADDRSIQSVANGYFDGAAVSALVLDSVRRRQPALFSRVRVIAESDVGAPPPVLVASRLSPELKVQLRQAFCTLHEREAGRRLLAELSLTRYVPGDPAAYAPLAGYYPVVVGPPIGAAATPGERP